MEAPLSATRSSAPFSGSRRDAGQFGGNPEEDGQGTDCKYRNARAVLCKQVTAIRAEDDLAKARRGDISGTGPTYGKCGSQGKPARYAGRPPSAVCADTLQAQRDGEIGKRNDRRQRRVVSKAAIHIRIYAILQYISWQSRRAFGFVGRVILPAAGCQPALAA